MTCGSALISVEPLYRFNVILCFNFVLFHVTGVKEVAKIKIMIGWLFTVEITTCHKPSNFSPPRGFI